MSKTTTFEAIWTVDVERDFPNQYTYHKSSTFSQPNREHLLEFKLAATKNWNQYGKFPITLTLFGFSKESTEVRFELKCSILDENGKRVKVWDTPNRLPPKSQASIPLAFDNFVFKNQIQLPQNRKFTIFCEITYDETQLLGVVKERHRIEAVDQLKRYLLNSNDSQRFLCKIFETEDLADISAKEISDKLESILKSENFSDLGIVVGKQKICAHKNILAARSPVFDAMFEWKNSVESQQNQIKIVDSNVESFHDFLTFLYTGKLQPQHKESIFDLLVLADKYQVDSLKRLCEDQLSELISAQSVLDLFEFAEFFNSQELKSDCLNWILSNESILTTQNSKWNSFYAKYGKIFNDKKVKQSDKVVYNFS